MSDYQLELAPAAQRSVTGPGGGADFNVEPQNVVMRYIICATDA